MSRRRRIAFVVAVGLAAAGAAVAAAIAPDGAAADLILLATGLVLGELLVLRLDDGSAVPLSYAVLIVLASSFAFPQYGCAVLAAELVATVLVSDRDLKWRLALLVERLVVAAATYAAYRVVWNAADHRETVAAVLGALGAAALAQVVVDVAIRKLMRLGATFSSRARLAWLAIASSGMLMAIGYRGVDGDGRVGIWAPLLFATPLLAAWYAFERLDSATRSYRQTIEALAIAPELGGLVPAGHAERVAAIAWAMGGELGLSLADTRDLEMAALLHHLGQVTVDDPGGNATEVATITSAMMREIRPLAAAGDIVGGETDDPKRRLAGQVLRVASEYDDLTVRDHTPSDVAIESLRSAPAYMYDERVVTALERVLRSPGLRGGRGGVASTTV
jgi:hypothetical protein